MGEDCGALTEALAKATEAAKNVDGKPEKSGVSSRSPMEKLGLRRVPMATGKGNKGHGKGRGWGCCYRKGVIWFGVGCCREGAGVVRVGEEAGVLAELAAGGFQHSSRWSVVALLGVVIGGAC